MSALEANKPYVIEGAWNETLSGDAQGTALNYTEGLLTGVYAEGQVTMGNYVLQNLGGKVAFYVVEEGSEPTIKANRSYLTVPGEARAAFYLDDNTTTAIKAIDALTSGDAQIFNAAGAQVPSLQKGMNIIKKADGTSYKVMVK